MNKKAQVVMFFILGIILFLSISLVVYYNTKTTESQTDKIQKDSIKFDVTPIQNYITECLYSLADDYIRELAFKGGFYDYSGQAGSYLNYGYFKLPMWVFRDDDKSVSKEEFQKRIESSLDANLNSCISDFANLREQYEIIEKAQPESKVTIQDTKVNILIKYPLEVKTKTSDDKVSFLNSFSTEVKIPLGRMLDLAYNLVNHQLETRALERITKEIAIFTLPKDNMYFSLTEKTWRISEIKEDFKYSLALNSPYIEFNEDDIAYPYFKNLLFTQNLTSDFSLYVNYNLDFPLGFSAKPHRGDVLHTISQDVTPNMAGISLPIPGIQIAHFLYSYEVPFVFTLVDYETGLKLYFGMQSYVEDNKPKKSFRTDPIDIETFNESFCSTEGSEFLIYPYDDFTREPILNVSMYYFCGEVCSLGESYYPTYNGVITNRNVVKLGGNLPSCDGGILVLEKEGYLKEYRQFDSYEGDVYRDSIYMTPMKDYKLNINNNLLNDEILMLSVESQDVTYTEVIEDVDDFNLSFPLKEQNLTIYATVTKEANITGVYFNDNITIDFSDYENYDSIILPITINRSLKQEDLADFLMEISNKYDIRFE